MDLNNVTKIVTEAWEKLSKDEDLIAAFKKDPVKTLESKLGIDLPDDQINAVITAIKAKLTAAQGVDAAKGLLDSVSSLFGKK